MLRYAQRDAPPKASGVCASASSQLLSYLAYSCILQCLPLRSPCSLCLGLNFSLTQTSATELMHPQFNLTTSELGYTCKSLYPNKVLLTGTRLRQHLGNITPFASGFLNASFSSACQISVWVRSTPTKRQFLSMAFLGWRGRDPNQKQEWTEGWQSACRWSRQE